MLSDDMDQVLRDYFRWASQNAPEDIGYPNREPTMRILFGGGVNCAGLSDDEAMWIDRILCHMKKDEPESYRVLRLIYRDGRSLRWMETKGMGSRKVLANMAWSAREFLRGALVTRKIMGAHGDNGSPTVAYFR